MGLTSRILGHCRRPRGRLGRLVARGMNLGHAPLTSWVLEGIPRRDVRRVLDVGCGGGGAMKRLARLLPGAEIHGVDHSDESLQVATRVVGDLIAQGRGFLRKGTVSDLPYDDGYFDLAVGIESHYFWPDLTGGLGEIQRVLRAGGRLVLGGGVYLGGRHDARNLRFIVAGDMNCQTLPDLERTVAAAGYIDVVGRENWSKGWFCVAGSKPGEWPSTPDATGGVNQR